MAQANYNQTVDGQSATLTGHGGTGNVEVDGTFGSGTLTLQYSVDGGTTWLTVSAAPTFTANGTANFSLPPCDIRTDLSGSTSPDLNTRIRQ